MIDLKALPEVLVDFLTAQSRFDSVAFAKTFAPDAHVYDERKDYHGTSEIQLWNEDTNGKYQTKMEPTDFYGQGDENVLTIMMSGTFPGSPLTVKFHFTIRNNKITSLRVS